MANIIEVDAALRQINQEMEFAYSIDYGEEYSAQAIYRSSSSQLGMSPGRYSRDVQIRFRFPYGLRAVETFYQTEIEDWSVHDLLPRLHSMVRRYARQDASEAGRGSTLAINGRARLDAFPETINLNVQIPGPNGPTAAPRGMQTYSSAIVRINGEVYPVESVSAGMSRAEGVYLDRMANEFGISRQMSTAQRDAETDEELRARILASFRNARGRNTQLTIEGDYTEPHMARLAEQVRAAMLMSQAGLDYDIAQIAQQLDIPLEPKTRPNPRSSWERLDDEDAFPEKFSATPELPAFSLAGWDRAKTSWERLTEENY